MKNYHELLQNILDNGVDQFNVRTQKTCRAVPGAMLQYDLRAGFPAITTKKLAFKTMTGELLGFFRGYDNAADFRALGCKIWDQNANETEAWLKNPVRKGADDLGRIYGQQWTNWSDKRIVKTYAEVKELEAKGYVCVMEDPRVGYLVERKINQVENALRTLLTNPSDRRIIVNGWNCAELDMAALPPCHMTYTFIAMEDTNELHLVQTQRSADSLLGVPFNVGSAALFLAIMARLSGFTASTVSLQFANAHIYMEDHESAVKEQLTRSHFARPKLVLSDEIPSRISVDQIPGVFTRIEPHYISLEGYQCHDAIKAPMAA